MVRFAFYSILFHVSIVVGALWLSQNSLFDLFVPSEEISLNEQEVQYTSLEKTEELKENFKKIEETIEPEIKKMKEKIDALQDPKIEEIEEIIKPEIRKMEKILEPELKKIEEALKEELSEEQTEDEILETEEFNDPEVLTANLENSQLEEKLNEEFFEDALLKENLAFENEDSPNADESFLEETEDLADLSAKEVQETYTTPPTDNDVPLVNQKISPSQNPSLKEIKNYTDLVELPGNPPLNYPSEALQKKQEGSVTLLYFVDEAGLVDQIQLIESSGVSTLDNEALRTYSRHQYLPGQSGWYKQQVNFKLKSLQSSS